MPIQFIKIKKRKEDLKWNELRHLPFDKKHKLLLFRLLCSLLLKNMNMLFNP